MELRLRRSSSTDKVFVLFSLCSLCSPWFKFQRTIGFLTSGNLLCCQSLVLKLSKNQNVFVMLCVFLQVSECQYLNVATATFFIYI